MQVPRKVIWWEIIETTEVLPLTPQDLPLVLGLSPVPIPSLHVPVLRGPGHPALRGLGPQDLPSPKPAKLVSSLVCLE